MQSSMEMESYFTKKYATAESNKTLSTVFDQCSMLACLAKTFSAMFKFGSIVAEK